MTVAENAAILGRAARNLSGIKNRQPLKKIILCGGQSENLDSELLSVIRDELNVKDIEYAADAGGYVSYEVKPQLKTLGPKYGSRLGKIRQYLAANAEKIVNGLKESDTYSFDIDGEQIDLTKDDLLISVLSKEGYSVQSDKGMTVILDTALDKELIEEGYMREIVSKIQTMRKEAGFEVTDHIRIRYFGDEEIEKVFNKYIQEIASDVLADEIIGGKNCNDFKEWDINGKNVGIKVSKI